MALETIPFPFGHKSFRDHAASFRDFAALHVTQNAIKDAHAAFPQLAANVYQPRGSRPTRPISKKIGIIGAGVAGLYAGLILDSLGVDYEILEANPDRVGGRIFTHRFNGDAGVNAPVNDPARYDYFDVGAMRYPNIPFMKRVFDLFDYIKISDLIIDYKLSSDNNLKYFNNRPPLNSSSPTVQDYFHVSVANGGAVPDFYAIAGVDMWTGKVYDHYKKLFGSMDGVPEAEQRKIFALAWLELTKQDHHSTRGYMLAGKEGKPADAPDPYPEPVVQWLETFDSATGLYDEAFVESVIDSLDFDWPAPLRSSHARNTLVRADPKDKTTELVDLEWYCLDGGSDRMTMAMEAMLKQKPKLGHRVTKIALTADGLGMRVDVDGKPSEEFGQVICTAPLGVMYHMDLDGCDLLYNQKQAIRSLQYDASVKVGLKFEKRWWEDPSVMGTSTILGGQSSTDLPIRTCVYPSYGLNCPKGSPVPGVLIASYTWAQDARRLGALSQGKAGSPEAEELVELTVTNLEKLHSIPREKMGPVKEFYAHAWYNDRFSRGAFALFGPAQFGRTVDPGPTIPPGPPPPASLFASVKAPAAYGRFHIAGEATSAHHAWVLGALNSAWRAVYNATLTMGAEGVELRKKLIEKWGIPDEENEIHLQYLYVLAASKAI